MIQNISFITFVTIVAVTAIAPATHLLLLDSEPAAWIFLSSILLVLASATFVFTKYSKNFRWIFEKISTIMNIAFSDQVDDKTDQEALDHAIKTAGYAYDKIQDIFYSRLDAWQRKMGYCRLYDEASATFGMIIDCEPIYFEFNDKKWLIEFWKGQYDLTTGCEIGIYVADRTEGSDIEGLDTFTGTIYQCVSDRDLIDMHYTLWKNDQILFSRKDKHWWLTGFKVGEYSEPAELKMDISISLKNKKMCDAFIKGLFDAGYSEKEIEVDGHKVSLSFNQPKTKQPMTRTKVTDEITQRKNYLLCKNYQKITAPYQSFPEKMIAIKAQSPWLYSKLLNLGKGDQFLHIYDKIKDYLQGELK